MPVIIEAMVTNEAKVICGNVPNLSEIKDLFEELCEAEKAYIPNMK